MSDLLAAALDYAARGLPVFPLVPAGKAPAVSRGFLSATTNPAKPDLNEWVRAAW